MISGSQSGRGSGLDGWELVGLYERRSESSSAKAVIKVAVARHHWWRTWTQITELHSVPCVISSCSYIIPGRTGHRSRICDL